MPYNLPPPLVEEEDAEDAAGSQPPPVPDATIERDLMLSVTERRAYRQKQCRSVPASVAAYFFYIALIVLHVSARPPARTQACTLPRTPARRPSAANVSSARMRRSHPRSLLHLPQAAVPAAYEVEASLYETLVQGGDFGYSVTSTSEWLTWLADTFLTSTDRKSVV